jgi:hypothetical protein
MAKGRDNRGREDKKKKKPKKDKSLAAAENLAFRHHTVSSFTPTPAPTPPPVTESPE